MLAGAEGDTVQWNSPTVREYFQEFTAYIHTLFSGTVENRFQKWYGNVSLNQTSPPKWIVHKLNGNAATCTVQQRTFFTKLIRSLRSFSSQSSEVDTVHWKATLDRGFGSSTPGAHEQLLLGDVVQVLIDGERVTEKFLTRSECTEAELHFFVVGALLTSSSSTIWACVKPCIRQTGNNQLPDLTADPIIQVYTSTFYTETTDAHQMLRLDGSVKKVGVIHDCGSANACVFSADNKAVHHSKTTLDTGTFFLLSRSMGFPPRRS